MSICTFWISVHPACALFITLLKDFPTTKHMLWYASLFSVTGLFYTGAVLLGLPNGFSINGKDTFPVKFLFPRVLTEGLTFLAFSMTNSIFFKLVNDDQEKWNKNSVMSHYSLSFSVYFWNFIWWDDIQRFWRNLQTNSWRIRNFI